MSDNDDFDTEDFDLGDFDDDGFGDLQGENTLADLWKNNPVVKIAVIGVGAVLLIGAIIMLGGGKDDLAPSRMGGGSGVNDLSVDQEISPAMQEALQEENNRRAEDAVRTGGTHIPMQVETIKGQLPLVMEEQEEDDPLERWRQMQDERLRNEQVMPGPEMEVAEVDTRTPAVNALSEAMAVQMEAILSNQGIASMKVLPVSPEDYLKRMEEKERQEREAELARMQESAGAQTISASDAATATILVPAGTIEYAQMLTEANTDAPGPVLAQVASGPLKGARLIGSFSATEEYLTLKFSTVVLDGVSYGVDAVAIDPETTLPGVATDVDKRYLRRVVLPAAAAFIEGLTEAIAESGSTTVTIQGETVSEETNDLDSDQEVSAGLAEAGEEIGEILDDMADGTKTLIRVRAGTPIGILFTAPVFDKPVTAETANNS